MTSPTPLEVFSRQVEAFNAHHVDDFISSYASDASVLSNTGLSLSGREALLAHYSIRLANPQLRCDVLSVIEVGNRWVVAHERVGDDQTSVEVIATFDVVDGLIQTSLLMLGEVVPV